MWIPHTSVTLGGGVKPGKADLGRALKPEHIPTHIVRGGKRYGMCDIIKIFNRYFVSNAFKQIVEQVEPGVHQFFPVRFDWTDGTLADDMYMMNICNRVDGTDREQTTAEFDFSIFKPETGTIIMRQSLVGECHLWIDKHIYYGHYMSDVMKTALWDAGMTGILFKRRNKWGKGMPTKWEER